MSIRLFLFSHLLNRIQGEIYSFCFSRGIHVSWPSTSERPWVSDSWTHTRNFTIGLTSKVWTWPEPHHQFCLFFGFGDSRLSGFTVSSHRIFVYVCTYVLTHTSMHGYGYMFCSSHMRLACLFFKKACSHSFPISSPVSTPFPPWEYIIRCWPVYKLENTLRSWSQTFPRL